MLPDKVVHCYIISLTVPPNLYSGSGQATISPPAAILRCGEDFETVSISDFLIIQIICPQFIGTDTTITAYKDGEVISLPVWFGPVPPPDDSVYGTYTFVSENECGRDIAVSRILRQGQYLH